MLGEVRRNLNRERYDKVAELAFLLIDREAFPPQPDFGAVLRLGFNLEFDLSVQCVDSVFASQNSRVEVKRSSDIQVVVEPLEHRVFRDNERNVQVACRTAVDTFSALPFQLDDLSVGHACRNGDTNLLAVNVQYLFMSVSSVAKGKRELSIVILSAEAGIPSTSSAPIAEQVLEEIGEAAPVVAGAHKVAARPIRAASAACTGMLILLILLPL